MNREEIEELAVSYSIGELQGEELTRFGTWRAGATAEELSWFAAIVDTAGELALGKLEPLAASPAVKKNLLSKLALDEQASENPDYSFIMGADAEADWLDIPVPGARIKVLSDSETDGHTIYVLELAPGAKFPAHRHHGVESAYMISGDLETEGRFLRAGDFWRAAPGSKHRSLCSRDGCRALLVTSYENFHAHDN